MNFKYIETHIKSQVGVIWFNRPEVHNAFNEEMISEITNAFKDFGQKDEVRVIVLRGRGKSFCAGADLNWLRQITNFSYAENYNEGFKLSICYYTIYTCPKPTIAMVHGAAIGGANGFIAACDMAFSDDEAVFSLSELKIGLVPACISPYIIKKTGEFNARDLMLTGRKIKGKEAQKLGLINQSYDHHDFEEHLIRTIEQIKSGGPAATAICKKLIYDVSNTYSMEEAISETASIIATVRKSDEGQEGMAAFLEKRNPNWIS